MANTCLLEITNCCDCPNHIISRIYTEDSFEHEEGVYCTKIKNKNNKFKLVASDDYNVKKYSHVPDWCPLLKYNSDDTSGDIFTSPIDYALKETMKQFENKNDGDSKLIYSALARSRAICEKIIINGINVYGMTFEQFCDQLDKKKNVIFLSDDEIEYYNKAVEIMNIMLKPKNGGI